MYKQVTKIALMLLPVFILAVILPIAVKRVINRQEKLNTNSEASTGGGTTSFILSPIGGNVQPGQTLPATLQLSINNTPGNLGVTAVKAVLNIADASVFSLTNADIIPALPSPWSYVRSEVAADGAGQTITIEAIYLAPGTSGYLAAAPVTFATLNLKASPTRIASTAFIVSGTSEIRAKLDNSDILSSNLPFTTYGVVAPTPTPTLAPTPTNTPTPLPTATPTPLPTATPTPLPTLTPTPTSPPPSLTLKIKFQGISSAKPNKVVDVQLRQGASVIYSENAVSMISNSVGVFSATLNVSANPGTYDVYVKGPVHLRRKITTTPFVLNAGPNILDSTTLLLPIGDMDGDNDLDLVDLNNIIGAWTSSDVVAIPANKKFDVDDNGFISISDISWLISNWSTSVVSGD